MTVSIQRGYTNDTHSLYYVNFHGYTITTTVTNNPSIVQQWLSTTDQFHADTCFGRCPIIGFDVEWHPNYTKNQQNPVAVLQLCAANRCLIFQIFHSPYSSVALSSFFNNYNNTFVGVSLKSDLQKLVRDYGIGGNAVSVDLGKLAAYLYDDRELSGRSLKDLAWRVLGKEVEKNKCVTMSEWDAFWLTDEQVMYACVDAYVSFEIGRALQANNYAYIVQFM